LSLLEVALLDFINYLLVHQMGWLLEMLVECRCLLEFPCVHRWSKVAPAFQSGNNKLRLRVCRRGRYRECCPTSKYYYCYSKPLFFFVLDPHNGRIVLHSWEQRPWPSLWGIRSGLPLGIN
jgi:hypothetical protein